MPEPLRFKTWLEGTRPGAKQGLYPLNYGGAGIYTPCDMANWSADAITYMPKWWLKHKVIEKPWPVKTFVDPSREQKVIWGKGMLADPAKEKPGFSETTTQDAHMTTLSTVMEAKQKFQTKFPKHSVGISGSINDHYLAVRVHSEADANNIPKEFHGVRVEVKVVGGVQKR